MKYVCKIYPHLILQFSIPSLYKLIFLITGLQVTQTTRYL